VRSNAGQCAPLEGDENKRERVRMITRKFLRDDIHREILQRLLGGTLAAGMRIDETKLAEELGISRTPLREALVQLELEGFLESRLGRGFWVTLLTRKDVCETYPMVAALEALAIKSTDIDSFRTKEAELERLAEAMTVATSDPRRAQELDHQWHSLLLSSCQNERLIETIDHLKQILLRYEYAYMSDAESVRVSAEQHHSIALALMAGNMDEATRLLEINWLHSMEALRLQLE
jgi:DNA-binding GntR family transcriptional regulator